MVKKKIGLFIVAILIISALILAGCTQKTTTTTTTSTSTTTTTTAAEPIELVFTHVTPEQAPIAQLAKAFGDAIEERSGGRVKFVYYWSNTLVDQDELVKAVQSGVADFAFYPLNSDFQPLTAGIMNLPFIGIPSMEAGSEIFWELYHKYPAVQGEFEGLKVLSARSWPPFQLHFTNQLVKLPADIDGLKIGCSGEVAKVINSVGGVPVEVGVQDLFMSLNSGLIDGDADHFPSIMTFGVLPLLKYHTIIGDGGVSRMAEAIIMNPDTFNKLPPDIQQMVEEMGLWYQSEAMKMDIGEVERALQISAEENHTVTNLTPAEIQAWSDAALPIHQLWIQSMESKGLPAGEVYDEVKALIAAME